MQTTTTQVMEAVRVLNNNAVLATDRMGGQAILLGRGIGFGMHLGDEIDPGAASQVFVPEAGLPIGQLATFLSEIPMDLVGLAGRMVEQAHLEAGVTPSHALVLALADHLKFAVERARQGIRFDYPLRWEVAQLYPAEHALGREVLRRVNTELSVDLPEEEATALAMHIVNAQFASGDLTDTVTMTQRISQVLEVVTTSLGIRIPEESMDAARFVTHLRYLFTRIQTNTQIASSPPGLTESIVAAAPDSHRVAERVRELFAMGGTVLSDDEVAYLSMHIARLADRDRCPAAEGSPGSR